jgi:hypothetical protein
VRLKTIIAKVRVITRESGDPVTTGICLGHRLFNTADGDYWMPAFVGHDNLYGVARLSAWAPP